MAEQGVTMDHGFLLKDVKFVSRNDGNLIAITLHCPFDTELWASVGGMIDDYFNVAFTAEQGELGLEEGREGE